MYTGVGLLASAPGENIHHQNKIILLKGICAKNYGIFTVFVTFFCHVDYVRIVFFVKGV